MGQRKGRTGNPNGRPKGSKNKSSGVLRESINSFLESSFAGIKRDLKKLSPKDRVKAYCDLLQYGLPKLQAGKFEFDFNEATDEQLDRVLEELKSEALEKLNPKIQ